MVGEIHIAQIFFTDASAAKIRPILLLKLNSFNDMLYLPLTSNTSVKGMIISNTDLKDGYISKPSIVVIEKPGVIATTLLLKKIVTLYQSVYQKIINNLIEFLKE